MTIRTDKEENPKSLIARKSNAMLENFCLYLEPKWLKKGQCSRKDQCSFWHESHDRAQKPDHNAATPSELSLSLTTAQILFEWYLHAIVL